MFYEENPKEYHSAIVDVTDKCNLRCRHCFYYREEHDSEELDDESFLSGLEELRKRHNIMSMGWCGGEPLYRKEVVAQGLKLFPLNTIYTNGTLPIPDVDNVMIAISIDGTPEIHDRIRGKGTFNKIINNVKAFNSKGKFILFLTTIHRINFQCIEEMIELLSQIPDTMTCIMFFTPLKKYKDVKGYKYTEEQKNFLDLTWEERDDVIYRVLKLKKRYPGKIFNPDRTLELMLSENAGMCTSRCNMPRRTLTLDLKLNRKLPCVLGRDVDCSKCGCVFPYLQQAKKEGDPEALRIRF